jgi:hypothetical protein
MRAELSAVARATAASSDGRWTRLHAALNWLVTVLRQHGDDARFAVRGAGASEEAAQQCATLEQKAGP